MGFARLTGVAALSAVVAVGAFLLLPSGGPPKNAAEPDHAHRDDAVVRLTDEQIARSKIGVATAAACTIARGVSAPGTVLPDPDRVGRVAAKVAGTVAELRKRLGDTVAKDEVVAVLESREVAEAKSEYQAAVVSLNLQKALYEREQVLADKKIIPEMQFLRTRHAFLEAELRVALARQKLAALDLSASEIARLSTQQTAGLRLKELHAPLAGQVIERRVDLGTPVGREGQESEIYVIADLSSLWVELAVSTSDLTAVAVGQPVVVAAGGDGLRAEAKIVFVSPLLNTETRSARVIAALGNEARAWRPGIFVTARILLAEQSAPLCVPPGALQSADGEQVVFVRTEEGFEKRAVAVGRGDEAHVEIVSGLAPGETVAATNSFVLKAELAKGEAGGDHAH
jgi:cobalt-zinc-cadmium efflux system membrane fusion protein